MATRGIVPRANGEGSIGTEKKHWGSAFFDKVAVKTLEVIGGGTENDAQPATVGWIKQGFSKMVKSALEAAGMRVNIGWEKSGYICFGALLGGLIIQWGEASFPANTTFVDVTYPVAFQKSVFTIPVDVVYGKDVTSVSKDSIGAFVFCQELSTLTKFRIASSQGGIGAFNYLAIGI